jgi:drug/metabolite transporter (DMT)-like permease
VWGLAQVAAKLTLAEVPPLLQSGLRSLGAVVLLVLWSRWRGLALTQRDGTAWAGGHRAGLIFAVEFGMIFVGLQYTAASRMIVFLYVAPFVVALGMPFLVPSERLDRWQLLGLATRLRRRGVGFYEGFVQPLHGERQWVGDALALGALRCCGAPPPCCCAPAGCRPRCPRRRCCTSWPCRPWPWTGVLGGG